MSEPGADTSDVDELERRAMFETMCSILRHDVRNRVASARMAAHWLKRKGEMQEPLAAEPRFAQFHELLDQDLVAIDALVGSSLPVWSPLGAAQPVPLRDIIARACRGLFVPHAVRIDVDVADDAYAHAPADAVLLCLRALTKNALEASNTGVVRVAVRADADERVVTSITDDGPGFSAEARKRAPEGGYSTKPNRRGYGICMCTRLAQHARGDVRIHEGTPTRVEVVLPCAPLAAPAETP